MAALLGAISSGFDSLRRRKTSPEDGVKPLRNSFPSSEFPLSSGSVSGLLPKRTLLQPHAAATNVIKKRRIRKRNRKNKNLNAVRRLMSSDSPPSRNNNSSSSTRPVNSIYTSSCCPSCGLPFDQGKKKKLIDTNCGHERCYSCMFKIELCPICNDDEENEDENTENEFGDPASSSPLLPLDHNPNILKKSESGSRLFGSETSSLISGVSNYHSEGFISGDSSPFKGPRSRTQSPSLRGPVSQYPYNKIYSSLHQSSNGSAPPSNAGGSRRYSYYSNHSGLNDSLWKQQQSEYAMHSSQMKPSFNFDHESGFQSTSSLISSLENSKIKETVTPPTNNNLSSPISIPSLETENDELSDSGESVDSFVSNTFSNLGPSAESELNDLYSPRKQHSVVKDTDTFDSRKSAIRRSSRIFPSQRPEFNAAPSQFRAPYWTLKPLFFEVPNAEASSLFLGRQWLFREISEHLNSDLPTNQGVTIIGSPGSGKTAIILQLVEYSCFGRSNEETLSDVGESIYSNYSSPTSLGQSGGSSSMKNLSSSVVSYHFCQADNSPTCLVPEFVHSIAAQLSQAPQLSPYYQLILNDAALQSLLSLPGCVSDPSNAFRKGILEPLSTLRISSLCLIVIDGLCDAELHRPDHGDTIGSFLSKHLVYFPPWLKILTTLRSSESFISKSLPFTRISLDKIDVDERLNKDMQDYILCRIKRSPVIQNNIRPTNSGKEGSGGGSGDGGSPVGRFTHFMVSKACKGSFLYAKMTLDLIERGHLVIKSSSSFNVLPLTIFEIFLLEFNLKFPSSSSFEKVEDILSTALAALNPLNSSELYHSITSLEQHAHLTWGEFLMRFSALNGFLIRRADETLMFFHPIFRDWLLKRSPGSSSKFLCDPRTGHAAIAFRMCRKEAPLSPDKTLELAHHILKAHIYKNVVGSKKANARDMQAMWVSMSTEEVSLSAVRNISSPNVKVSRLLLLAGASPDSVTDYLDEAPLLCVFASQGYSDMVSLLLEFGANVNASNLNGMTPLIFAAKGGHVDLVKLLLSTGSAPINHIDKTETCALVYAARFGFLEIVSYLVSCDWITNEVYDLGLSEAVQQAFIAAAKGGHESVLEFLLDMSEVDSNAPDTLTGETGLTASATSGQKSIVEILLRRHASVNTHNLKDIPPLIAAISGGHWPIVELLIKEGAHIEETDGNGRTPLIIAALEGHIGILELLLSKGANENARDSEGLSPLGWACLKGQVLVLQSLLSSCHDVNINQYDKTGRSLLDLAALKGDTELVQLLLDHEADMEHEDENGLRPLDKAICNRHAAVVNLFLKRGAKLSSATWSYTAGKPEILLILLNKLLEDGNTLYKRSRFEDAAHRYSYALKRLPAENFESHETTFEKLRIHLLLNLSRCKRKLGYYGEAIDRATEVIGLRPDCLEALHAKARAHREANQYDEALNDLTEALKVSPQNRDVHKFIMKVKEEMKIHGHGGKQGAPVGSFSDFSPLDDSKNDVSFDDST